MIIGVAQLVLNAPDLDRGCQPYLDAGWTETFRVDRLANHAVKRPLQAVERSELGLVHLTPPDGVAVEVTCYADGPPSGESVYRLEDRALELRASAAAGSARFWHALGFREEGDGWLQARAVLPVWRLRLRLEPSAEPRPVTTVDACGCVLVTVLTTALEHDLGRLRETGLLLRFTASWTEQIGTRTTSVAIVEGPSGELVELLQAPRPIPWRESR